MSKARRRFPAPWSVRELPGGWQVIDAQGTPLAWVYARDDLLHLVGNESHLSTEEARRVAANIAKLPSLLSR